MHRVDEAGRALRLLVSGDAEFDAAQSRVPMPVLAVGVGLDAIAAHVEPHRRVERRILPNKKMHELVVESGAVLGSAEVALGQAPVANSFGDAADELAHSGLALGRPDLAVKIF